MLVKTQIHGGGMRSPITTVSLVFKCQPTKPAPPLTCTVVEAKDLTCRPAIIMNLLMTHSYKATQGQGF